jgi:hypothetical protein
MKQINTFSLYELAKALQRLRDIPTDPTLVTKDNAFTLFTAHWWLDNFLEQETIPLDVSLNSAQELSTWLQHTAQKIFAVDVDGAPAIEAYELNLIATRLDNFETVLNAELQKHLTYLVSQIGGLSMPLLVNKAEVNLPEDALPVIPDSVKKDFREAGRCLAFEVPTAAGFHAMRATEAVLRIYYKLVTGNEPDRIDWGTCTQELKKGKANQKIVQVLDQIRDLHRNPLMHPQDFLTMKEAIRLFDIAKSAIGSLAEEIAKLKAVAAAAEAAAENEKAAAALAAKIVPALTDAAPGNAIKIVR